MKTVTYSFDVYLRDRKIDTVFHTFPDSFIQVEMEESVRNSLINHDGYSREISVIRNKKLR